jgi:hypothetical protein
MPNKAVNWDFGKLSPFLKRHSKRPPTHQNPLQRR